MEWGYYRPLSHLVQRALSESRRKNGKRKIRVVKEMNKEKTLRGQITRGKEIWPSLFFHPAL